MSKFQLQVRHMINPTYKTMDTITYPCHNIRKNMHVKWTSTSNIVHTICYSASICMSFQHWWFNWNHVTLQLLSVRILCRKYNGSMQQRNQALCVLPLYPKEQRIRISIWLSLTYVLLQKTYCISKTSAWGSSQKKIFADTLQRNKTW